MITLEHYLVFAAALFSLSIAGIIINRKNADRLHRFKKEIKREQIDRRTVQHNARNAISLRDRKSCSH